MAAVKLTITIYPAWIGSRLDSVGKVTSTGVFTAPKGPKEAYQVTVDGGGELTEMIATALHVTRLAREDTPKLRDVSQTAHFGLKVVVTAPSVSPDGEKFDQLGYGGHYDVDTQQFDVSFAPSVQAAYQRLTREAA